MHSSGWVWYREADDAHALEDGARLRAVLGHCPTSIAVLDEAGILVGYNRELASLFTVPPPLGEPAAQLFDEGPRAMLAEVVALAGTRQRAGAIISLRSTVGEEHEIEVLVATLPGDGARTIGVVMAADDRTKRIRDESERSVLEREIGEANCQGAIDLSLSAVCHDLNNVLATMTLGLGLLRSRCETDDPRIRTSLGELDEAVSHGAEIIARARTRSQVVVVRHEVDVRTCVEAAAVVVAPLVRRARATLAVHATSTARVRLGRTELTQVLTNLLANAAHAIQEAQRPGRIDVTVECATPGTVTLSVRDDGVGIEPSQLVDSFEAFQTTRAARGGTGLGLTIAREIVERAGGHIDVLSTPGRATEMRIVLPVAPHAEEAATVA